MAPGGCHLRTATPTRRSSSLLTVSNRQSPTGEPSRGDRARGASGHRNPGAFVAPASCDRGGEAAPTVLDAHRWHRGAAPRALRISPTSTTFRRRRSAALFLLNGWNEIAESESTHALEALRDLDRTFPSAGILVATRTHHIGPPLPGALRASLLSLSRTQRANYLGNPAREQRRPTAVEAR